MAKIFVHVTRVKNAMGMEQPITTLTSISGKSKKNDYVCGKCGAKLTRQDVLFSDGTCPKCGEPIHMGTAFLNRQKNVRDMTISDTELDAWFERDRAHVCLKDKKTERTIVEWRDEEVNEAVEDGFLNPRKWHESAFKYAKDRGLLKKVQNANLTEKDITPGNYKTFMKTPSNWEEVPGSNGYKWTHIPTGKTMSSKVRGELMRRADVFHGELRENGARWSTTDIYPHVEGRRRELIKDPSKSLGETLKPGKPGTLANDVSLDDPALLREIKSLDRQGYSVERLVKVVLEYNPKLDPQEVKKFVLQARRNAMPPDSGFEKEAAIAERRGSSARNAGEFAVGDVVGLTPATKRMPSVRERGVKDLMGRVTSVQGDDLMVKFEDGQSLWFMTHELVKKARNAERPRPTDVGTWDEIPGLKNADFEVGDTVTVDKPEHGNQYHGMVGTVMELHGDLVDVRFAGVGTLAVHVTNLRPGGRRKNTEGRKSNPGWLKSKDEGKWSKAKEAVKKEYGGLEGNWGIVTSVFEKMGGKPK